MKRRNDTMEVRGGELEGEEVKARAKEEERQYCLVERGSRRGAGAEKAEKGGASTQVTRTSGTTNAKASPAFLGGEGQVDSGDGCWKSCQPPGSKQPPPPPLPNCSLWAYPVRL